MFMSKKSSKKELEKKELLYKYWHELPLVVQIETPAEEALAHEVRNLILYYIRKGKEEKWIDGTKRIRYAFSAKELLDMANKKLDEKMKLQSMYFHLQKLQEYGTIEVIATLHEGRHNIAYFGRTARGFLFEGKKEKSKYDEYFAGIAGKSDYTNKRVSIGWAWWSTAVNPIARPFACVRSRRRRPTLQHPLEAVAATSLFGGE